MTVALSPEAEAAPAPQATGAPIRERIGSLDIIRGAVMVLMAIDHVRVYAGVPAGGPTPGLFFTRWVTHFAAPAFFFLAGTGTFLHGASLPSRGMLSRFLLTRGAWLIVLEMTVIRLSWTFNIDYGHYMLAGVIWALGWCMILMAVLIHLPLPAIAALGIAIVFGHNLVDPHVQALGRSLSQSGTAWLWQVLYFGGGFKLFGGPPLLVL
ncbi:MAG: heparan-alpha-glucosaminide N-acetyltransferase domain-containing protein, partial [Gemmatimonadota bacterium]